MFCFIKIVIAGKKQLPTITNINKFIEEPLDIMQQSAMELVCKSGSISSILLAYYNEAISLSTYIGDGELELFI